MNRVAITGIGVVSSIGNNITEFWNNIKNGKHGFDYIKNFDTTNFPIKVAGEVKNFDPLIALEKKELRRTDLYCQYALEAARQAVLDSNLEDDYYDSFRIGTIIGSGIGGIHTFEKEYEKFHTKGSRFVSPFTIPMLIPNMASGMVAMKHGFKGTNYCISSACATSTHAIGEAFELIKSGKLDACLVGGSEASITPFTLAGFNNMNTLSKSQNPDRASIPFDKDRDGFVMGEGSGILILEDLDKAIKRNAKIYTEVVGYGATSDAYHITCPDPNGESSKEAILNACQEANITLDQIDYINAHGTSTPINDKYETNTIKNCFGNHSRELYISSTKSMTGHMLGAAGSIEAIICALALKNSFIPMTANYKSYDEDCDLNYVTNKGIDRDISYTLSNSLGFGGHNAVLCFKKYL